MQGKLITIEGIDGSGKGTQSKLLIEALEAAGKKVKMYSFPAYESTFYGREIGAFLRGEFGSFEQVHPKLAAILFACDRLEQKPSLQKDLAQGTYIVCDRYVESNAAHQSAKLGEADRPDFLNWIKQLEYHVHGLPKPDMTFFLDLPIDYSKQLVLKKQQRSYTEQKEDIQEAQHGYLDNVYQVYKMLEKSEGWTRIECVDQQGLKSIEQIHLSLIQQVRRAYG